MAAFIKRIFQKKKLDVKFKKAGEGHKLTDDRPKTSQSQTSTQSQPYRSETHSSQALTAEKQRAAEAALARSQGQNKIVDPSVIAKARLRRDIELEKKKEQEALGQAKKCIEPEEIVKESAHSTVILFKCPDIGAVVLPKDEMEVHIHEFLLSQLAEEPEMASALMIHTLNKDKDKVTICVETLVKYLDNIISNPSEEKFRKIRIANKAFSDRVVPLAGTEEFLQAAGFILKKLPFEDHDENFYVMEESLAADTERLKNIKDVLLAAEPIKPQLDRALKVYHPSKAAVNFTIPNEFYTLSPQELKKEQQRKQEAVEQLGMLRTKAMRERDERREILKYRYTLIRVRFPDGILLQGTFKATEKLTALIEFVRENLVNDWMPFQLMTQVGVKLDDEKKMLAEMGLTPAVVVNFEWDKTVLQEIKVQQGHAQPMPVLKPEIMALIQDIPEM